MIYLTKSSLRKAQYLGKVETENRMIYVKDDIPSKILTKYNFTEDVEAVFIEINFWRCQRLLCGTYCLPSQNDNYFFDSIDKSLVVYSIYEKVTLAH